MDFHGGDDILGSPKLVEWLRRMRPYVEGDPPLVPPAARKKSLP